MRFSSTALAIWLCSSAVTALPTNNTYSVFLHPDDGWHADTTIEFPNTTAFANVTERWDSFDPPTYAIAVSPASEEDVATAVKIARSINLPFLGTGGRHSWSTTLGNLNQGLAIDLSKLNSVEVDAEAGTLTIGGGTKFGEITQSVYEAGYQIPIGSCACPGMVGATVGGGVGRWQGLDGLIMDSLLSVRFVTADGKLIDVSENSNPDLYWAVRGAAPNFGLITSATYKLSPQTNNGQMLSADFILPAASNASFFDMLESLKDNMPAELSAIAIIEANTTTGEAQILTNWVYFGPEDKGREFIDPILELNPIATNISLLTYDTLIPTALFKLGVTDCAPLRLKGYGVNYRNLSSSTYQTVFGHMNDFYAAYPDGRGSSIQMEIFAPQAVQAIPTDATAYPWRDSKGYVLISFGWNTTETEQAGDTMAAVVRSDFVATSGYDDLAVYVSYAHGDESREQMYGSNLPRLVQLKNEWDPDNVFRFYHDLATDNSGASISV